MVVKIRLARFGKRNAPFYNIVVAQARSARNSKPMEVLGTYDPIPKEPPDGEGSRYKDIKLDISRAKYWLGVGAQPSDPAWRLLAMIGLLQPKFGKGRGKLPPPSSELESGRSDSTTSSSTVTDSSSTTLTTMATSTSNLSSPPSSPSGGVAQQ